MRIRAVITAALFLLGMLICIGAVGHLDFLDAQGVTYDAEELWGAVWRGIIGIALMGAAVFTGRDLEFEDEG